MTSKLETIMEQTDFLLTKQKESKDECLQLFRSILTSVERKIEKTAEGNEERAVLERIADLLSGQAQKIEQDSQEDIAFLTEQMSVLQQIKQKGMDPAQEKEILDMMVSDDDIMDTKTFKDTVSEESAISKQNLSTIINDLKEALEEGSAEEVELYLQTILQGDKECCQSCDDDCDSCESDCNDEDECFSGEESCQGCSDKDGCSGGSEECCKKNVNIFAHVNNSNDKK